MPLEAKHWFTTHNFNFERATRNWTPTWLQNGALVDPKVIPKRTNLETTIKPKKRMYKKLWLCPPMKHISSTTPFLFLYTPFLIVTPDNKLLLMTRSQITWICKQLKMLWTYSIVHCSVIVHCMFISFLCLHYELYVQDIWRQRLKRYNACMSLVH